LEGEVRSLQAATPQTAPSLAEFFSAEQIEELGEDQATTIVSTVLKAAKKEVQAAIEAEVKPLRDQRQAETQAAAEAVNTQFMDKLTELFPDWADVDQDPIWHAHLAENDPATGIQRQVILQHHHSRNDAGKVAKMFEAFANLQSPVAVTPPVTPHGTGAGVSGDIPRSQSSLRSLTKAEISAFYKQAALGKVSDQQRAEFEARLKLTR
jgi:hypothetical protein